MSRIAFLILSLTAVFNLASARQLPVQDVGPANGFSRLEVKKRVAGRICDSCEVNYALSADRDFSYIMTGSEHSPSRFYPLMTRAKASLRSEASASIQLISIGSIGITFLPNFIQENGKRLQLYRSYGGPDYNQLEFSASLSGKRIKPWTALSSLGEDPDYAFQGIRTLSGKTVTTDWKRTFFAGNFNLSVKDTLKITLRDQESKAVVKTISVIRPEDKANNFIFYQLPMEDGQFSDNLQRILNYGSGLPKVYSGATQDTFKKNYGTLGIIRFGALGKNEELQYAFENRPGSWHSIRPMGPDRAAYLVLNNELPAGSRQDIFLRYAGQQETVHKISIYISSKPFKMPWGEVALFALLLLFASGTAFFLWNRRNKRKLSALKSKAEDTETRLALLSGQLNPHFLFNSLNAIQGTIHSSDPTRASGYIASVASFMRGVMDNSKKEFISLEDELKIEGDYLRLEQERLDFSFSFDLSADIPASLVDFPPLLLQPVLENSIRHAFGRDLPAGRIWIKIFSAGSALIIEVCDNGTKAWVPVAGNEGHGLSLVRKRIAVYNEKLNSLPITMEINNKPGKGTITTFTFKNWL